MNASFFTWTDLLYFVLSLGVLSGLLLIFHQQREQTRAVWRTSVSGRLDAAVDGRAYVFPARQWSPVRLALGLFIVLQVLDLVTTLTVFSHGGIELNPVVKGLMPWTGRFAAVVASKAILIGFAIPLGKRRRVLYFADALYSGIVIWNLLIVFALRQA